MSQWCRFTTEVTIAVDVTLVPRGHGLRWSDRSAATATCQVTGRGWTVGVVGLWVLAPKRWEKRRWKKKCVGFITTIHYPMVHGQDESDSQNHSTQRWVPQTGVNPWPHVSVSQWAATSQQRYRSFVMLPRRWRKVSMKVDTNAKKTTATLEFHHFP